MFMTVDSTCNRVQRDVKTHRNALARPTGESAPHPHHIILIVANVTSFFNCLNSVSSRAQHRPVIMSTRVTNVNDVDAEVWIKAFAAHLKSTGKVRIKPPCIAEM